MTEQLAIVSQPPKLTDRQQRALDIITTAGWEGITTVDLGTRVHGHYQCQWCLSAGMELGKALRRKGLVQQRRRPSGTVWTVGGKLASAESVSSFGGEIPF